MPLLHQAATMAGRPRRVSNVEVLAVILDSADPFLFTTEIAEELDMSQQGVHKRLVQLEDGGYVRSKTKNSRAWWLTPAGRSFVVEKDATERDAREQSG